MTRDDSFKWLTSKGEIASRIRALDWSSSPLGPPSSWPQSLRTTINFCLASKFPMYLWWGPENVNIYNDSYIPTVGPVRHPSYLGKPAHEMWPEIWETMQRFLEQTRRGETVQADDLPFFLERNGFKEECFFSFSFSPAFDEDGKVCGAIAISVETTAKVTAERRVAETTAELERSKKRLEDFFMQAPVPMVIFEGAEHRFTLANPLYEKFVGRKVGGKILLEAFTQEEAGYYVPLLDGVYRTGVPYVGNELPVRLPDSAGVIRDHWLNIGYHPFFDESGKPKGILAIILDVTDFVEARRKAEEIAVQLAAEQNRLETIFRQSPAAMVLWTGPDFVFEKVNPEYQAIFPDRELQGKPFLEACPEFKDQPFFDLLQKVLTTGEPFVGHEVLARHKDHIGGPLVDHYYNFTYMRVNDTEGKPYGVYDHAIDVTDQVLARRTLEKNEQRLKELADNLRSAVVARDTFLGIASHELKTPLTSLKLQIQMNERILKRKGEAAFTDERLEKFLENTHFQTDRLARLVDDMLDVSRIHSGKLTMNKSEIDLSHLIHEILVRFHPQFESLGCRLSEAIMPNITARLDGPRIEQVMINFITNVIKYAPGKPVHVKVELSRFDTSRLRRNQ